MDVSLPRQNREHLPLTHTEPLGNLADRHTVRVLPLDFLVAPEPLKHRRLGDEQPLPAEGCCQRARASSRPSTSAMGWVMSGTAVGT